MQVVIPFVMGVISFVVGCFLLFSSVSSFQYAYSLNNYVGFAPAALINVSQPKSGYIEGLISENNTTNMENWVAYTHYGYEGMETYLDSNPNSMDLNDKVERKRPIWKMEEQVTPPLLIEVENQTVEIFSGYRFYGSAHSWVSTEDYIEGVTKKYEGFKVGDRVTVIGRSVAGQESPVFQAKVLSSGSFKDYQGDNQFDGGFLLIAGLVFTIVGIIACAVGFNLLL